jgi:hypothetical protein
LDIRVHEDEIKKLFTTDYLPEVEHLSLNNPSTGNAAVLYNTSVPVLFTVFLTIGATEEHGMRREVVHGAPFYRSDPLPRWFTR